MAASKRETFFVTCAPGLEPLLHGELRDLRLARTESQVGGCVFEGTLGDARRVNLWSRVAIRVLRRMARFMAPDETTLYETAKGVEWERYLRPSGTLVVDGQVRDSSFTHSRFLEQLVKDAVCDRLRDRSGERPSVDKDDPDLRVNIHVSRDRATLSIDSSGQSLHKRGWRVHQGRAPLAETTAAALLLHAGWNQRAPLLDPFCGTGTILIEGALQASRIAPGLYREQFGFERWLDHDAAAWKREREEARAERIEPRKLSILGWDRDPERVEQARENARSAGVEELVRFEVGEAATFAPRPGWNGLIVTNPPYGERVGEVDWLRDVYREFGGVLRERCSGYELALLSGNPVLTKALGLRGERVAIKNGAIDCELLMAEIR